MPACPATAHTSSSSIDSLFRAFDEATALGHGWIGPEDFLLAILASEDRSPAVVALEACGVRYDDFIAAWKHAVSAWDPPVDSSEDNGSASTNPAAHELIGRAEGLAAGLGAAVVSPEHVLIAYLWDSRSGLLEKLCDVTREDVLERLRALGVDTPAGSLPPVPERRPSGPRVFVPYAHLMPVVHALMERLPRDSGFGFNHDGEARAWVLANAEIDLKREVGLVLRELGIEPTPSSG